MLQQPPICPPPKVPDISMSLVHKLSWLSRAIDTASTKDEALAQMLCAVPAEFVLL